MSDAADLYRYFCLEWCPKCSRMTPIHVMHDQGDKLMCAVCYGDALKPGLHTRDPRTKVEGLYWGDAGEDDRGGRYKAGWGLHDFDGTLRPTHAADLLVMGVLRVAWDNGDIYEFIAGVSELLSFPEAVAIAYHRMLDAEQRSYDENARKMRAGIQLADAGEQE